MLYKNKYYLNKNFESELATLHKTREKLKKINNGNLSTNVRLYLDRQQASLVIHQAKSTHQLALTKTVNIYQTAISETELDWKKMLRLAKYQTNRLSDAEIKEYLAIGGATRQKIVLEPARLYQEKINQAKKIDQRFERLAQELNKKIAEILQRDRELAQLLK